MKESIFGFMAAGTAIGFIVGLVEALVGLSSGLTMPFILGSLGLHGLFAATAAIFLGLLHPFVPINLQLSTLLTELLDRLVPDNDEALQSRCRIIATIWVSALSLIGLLYLLNAGYRILLTRVQAPEFASVAVSLFGLILVASLLSIAVLTRAAFARLVEWMVRRRPSLTALVHPVGNLAVAVFISGLWLMADWTDREGLAPSVPWAPILAVTTIFFGTTLVGEWFKERLVQLTWAKSVQLSLVPIILIGACVFSGLRMHTPRVALARDAGINQLMVALFRLPFDQDGDGYSPSLSGGDCNDDDPNIHPAAIDIPGNNIDENCDGVATQEKVESRAKRTWPVPLRSLGFKPPYNLVLVTIESLRADHIGFYGYKRETTPAIDDMASESIVFKKAYAASSNMFISLASLMTGRYPSELERTRSTPPKYADSNVFLAKYLTELGYYTAAFPSHWYFEEPQGLGSGFSLWQPYSVEKGRMASVPTAETVVTAAVEYLNRLEANPGRSHFIWLHVIDPGPKYITHLDVPRFGDSEADLYDHEVRYVDTWLDWFFETLRRRSDWNRTVLAVVGTEGEKLGGETTGELGQSNIAVPLILRIPGLEPRPVESAVSLIDVAPTFLDLAGSEFHQKSRKELTLRGRSLLPAALGWPIEPRPIFAELPESEETPLQLMWLDGNSKLTFDGRQNRWSLHDILRDPWEQEDLFTSRSAQGARLRNEMLRFQSDLNVRPAKR